MTTATKATNLGKFRQVYADAVIHNMTDEDWEKASKLRQLNWHGERMPLAEAAKAYATICDGYNDFKPNVLAKLLAAFPNDGIEVTPARESSVAVYLHIPKGGTVPARVKVFILKRFDAKEVDIVDRFTCLQDGEAELDGEALRIWWD